MARQALEKPNLCEISKNYNYKLGVILTEFSGCISSRIKGGEGVKERLVIKRQRLWMLFDLRWKQMRNNALFNPNGMPSGIWLVD